MANAKSFDTHRPTKSTVTASLVWLAALVLYVSTSAPGIAELFDDSLEFQVVAPTFGIAHPTGYPFYTITGGLWSNVLFPFGNWAWRMNIFSALAAATAVLLVYLCAGRLAPRDSEAFDGLAGLAAAVTFALGPVWWRQATIAEVYAMHGLFVAAILTVAVTIPPLYAQEQTTVGTGRPAFRMTLLSFLAGLSLAHHRMTVLLLPGLAVYLLWSVPKLRRPRAWWLVWAGAFVLPLGLYLWIPLRASQGFVDLNGSYVNTMSGFADHVLARGYTGFFTDDGLGVRHSLTDSVAFAWRQLGVPASLLSAAGLVLMPLRTGDVRKRWSLLTLVLATNAIFGLWYQVPDWEVFFLPVLLILSLFTGAGVSIVSDRVANLNPEPHWASIAGALLTALVVVGIVIRGEYVDRSRDWEAHLYAYLLGQVEYPPESCVIGLEGEITALKYIQTAENRALNALPIVADAPEARALEIEACLDRHNPTYITRELPGIEERYSFSGEGPLVRVWPRGHAQAQPLATPLQVELPDLGLRLQGYALRFLEFPGGPVLELTLGWLPAEPLNRDLKVSLRLVDTNGNPVLTAKGAPAVKDGFPLRQVAPSSTWQPGAAVRDVHYMRLPEPDEVGGMQVIVYDAETVEELGRYHLSFD